MKLSDLTPAEVLDLIDVIDELDDPSPSTVELARKLSESLLTEDEKRQRALAMLEQPRKPASEWERDIYAQMLAPTSAEN